MKRSVFDHLGKAVTAAVRPVLVVGGLACLTAAAWTFALPAGLAAAGVSLIYLDWASRS